MCGKLKVSVSYLTLKAMLSCLGLFTTDVHCGTGPIFYIRPYATDFPVRSSGTLRRSGLTSSAQHFATISFKIQQVLVWSSGIWWRPLSARPTTSQYRDRDLLNVTPLIDSVNFLSRSWLCKQTYITGT